MNMKYNVVAYALVAVFSTGTVLADVNLVEMKKKGASFELTNVMKAKMRRLSALSLKEIQPKYCKQIVEIWKITPSLQRKYFDPYMRQQIQIRDNKSKRSSGFKRVKLGCHDNTSGYKLATKAEAQSLSTESVSYRNAGTLTDNLSKLPTVGSYNTAGAVGLPSAVGGKSFLMAGAILGGGAALYKVLDDSNEDKGISGGNSGN